MDRTGFIAGLDPSIEVIEKLLNTDEECSITLSGNLKPIGQQQWNAVNKAIGILRAAGFYSFGIKNFYVNLDHGQPFLK